jgi:hypothetical protein
VPTPYPPPATVSVDPSPELVHAAEQWLADHGHGHTCLASPGACAVPRSEIFGPFLAAAERAFEQALTRR